MRYNFCSVNPTIFDLEGQPFYGFLQFVAPGTTKEYVNVYDKDDHNLGHIVFTNAYGRLDNQIFLRGTVDVQYWKYIGTQFDPEDETQWALIRTERVLDPEDNLTFKVDGMAATDTVDEMRAFKTDGLEEGTTMMRTGYYVGGDHEPLMYRWDPLSRLPDDGGYVIQPDDSTTTGRWIAVFPEYINIKWFGVKSASLESQTTYQSSSMLAAVNRANEWGKQLYFPAEYANTFYGVDNVDIDVDLADIHMDLGVRLVARPGTQNTLQCYNLIADRDEQVFIGPATELNAWSIKAHELWTAEVGNWGFTADIVHWNKNVRMTGYNDCELIIETDPPVRGMNFSNVVLKFASDEFLLDQDRALYIFDNMEFTDRYFKEGQILDYNGVEVDKSCTTDIENFRDPVNWLNLHQYWDEPIINCQGQRMGGVELTLPRTLVNVNIGNITTIGSGTLSLTTGTVNGIVMDNRSASLTLNNIVVSGAVTNINVGTITLLNSTIENVSAVMNAAFSMTIDKSNVACALSANIIYASHSEFGHAAINVVNGIEADGCSFLGVINNRFNLQLHLQFVNNIFGKQSKIFIKRADSSTATNVKATSSCFVNNTIMATTGKWIEIDHTGMVADDQLHDYIFDGNKGVGSVVGHCKGFMESLTKNADSIGINESNKEYNLNVFSVAPVGTSSGMQGYSFNLVIHQSFVIANRNWFTFGTENQVVDCLASIVLSSTTNGEVTMSVPCTLDIASGKCTVNVNETVVPYGAIDNQAGNVGGFYNGVWNHARVTMSGSTTVKWIVKDNAVLYAKYKVFPIGV